MIRLRGILELLSSHGSGEIRSAALEEALARDGREVRSALASEGVVREAARAETVPCDGRGCAREVRELPRELGAPRRLFGVCTRDPVECEAVAVSESEIAQQIVSREAFVAAVQRALRLVPALDSRVDDAGDVVCLGQEQVDGEARLVLLVWRPSSPFAQAVVAARTATGRVSRVLTPATLSSLLTVRDGQIAPSPRLELVTPAEPPTPRPGSPESPGAIAAMERPKRSAALDGLRELSRWNEITLFEVDEDDQIGVTFDTRMRRLSCIDFGLASEEERRPLAVFKLLKTVCQGNGLFTTRAFGKRSNGKRMMTELRYALQATFGLQTDPFEKYSFRDRGWKPKFRALADAPAEVAAALREAGSRPQNPT